MQSAWQGYLEEQESSAQGQVFDNLVWDCSLTSKNLAPKGFNRLRQITNGVQVWILTLSQNIKMTKK